MRILAEWFRRLQYLIHRRKHEEDLRREMQIHRELMGEPLRFGNTLRLREESRDVWGWKWLDNLVKDLIYGIRQLRKTPGFTALAVLTLAIAIGSITIFSGLMKGLLFAELPVRDPAELRQVDWSFREQPGSRRGESNFSYPVYRYVQARTASFSDLVCWSEGRFLNLRFAEDPVRVSVQFVSGNFFDSMGVGAIVGRPISPEDESARAPSVVVLSHGAWQRLFGSDEKAVGRQVTLGGSPFVIVGVMASKEFQDTPMERWAADLIVPASKYSETLVKSAEASNAEASCRIIGRLRAGVSANQARLESEELVRQAFLANPIVRQGRPVNVDRRLVVGIRGLRGIDQLNMLSEIAPMLILLLIASLLAIVCSNIAAMTLARGAVRRAEVATRLALGASRKRIVMQLFTESLLLAAMGGAIGVALCYVVKQVIPWPFVLDFPVLAITGGLTCTTGLIFGLAPALTSTRLNLTSVMKQATPGALGQAFRSGNILIGVQVTLSLLLLVAAGLQVRSLTLLMVPANFEPENVLTIQAYPRESGYSPERAASYFEDAVRRLGSLPGLSSITASSGDGIFSMVSTGSNDVNVQVIRDMVAPRFFETMKVPVLMGREISWSDRRGAPPVIVVNETFVRTVFPEGGPLGKIVRFRGVPAEIVGVVADSNSSVGDAYAFGQVARPAIYASFQQQLDSWSSLTISARVTSDASALAPTFFRYLRNVDADVIVDPAVTQASQANHRFNEQRLLVAIVSAAGLVALVEVAFGIYGLLSFFVGTHTSEIGLRIALGARRIDVLRLVLRKSLVPVAIGTLLGLAGAPVLAQVLDSGGFLVGAIRVIDVIAIAGAALFFLGVALTASLEPARRASRAHPMQALRHN